MKVIEILHSLVGKTGFVFTKLSQKLRCLNEQQEERSFDQFVSISFCWNEIMGGCNPLLAVVKNVL